MAVAGQVVLREHPAHGGLVQVSLHEIPPCPIPPQALDRDEIGPGAVLNGDGPVIQIPVLVVKGANLPLLHGGTEKAGGIFRWYNPISMAVEFVLWKAFHKTNNEKKLKM